MSIAKLILIAALSIAFVLPASAQEHGAKPSKEANLHVDVSAALINTAVQRSVDRTEPVDETILETPIRGLGRTLGAIRTELVPDDGIAIIDVVFQGYNCSQTVGERPHVLIYTTTATALDVRRRVVFDGTAIRTYAGPARGNAFTNLLGIESRTWPARITEQIAERGYVQSVDAAEAESAHKTAWRVSHRLDEDLTPAVSSLSKSIGRELKAFQRAELKLEALDFGTSSKSLHAALRFSTPKSPPRPSGALPADIDLGVRIHDGLVNHESELELGGRSFQLHEMSKIVAKVTRGLVRDGRTNAAARDGLKKLAKFAAELAGKPVTITFAKKDPMLVAFADQGFRIEFRIASIRRDDTVYSGLRIGATYRFTNAADGVHAVRQGPVKVTPFVEQTEAPQKAEPLPALLRLLEDQLFSEVLTERLTLTLPALPAVLANVPMQAPRAYARDGWLGIGWTMKAR